jgi:hypothetical protein
MQPAVSPYRPKRPHGGANLVPAFRRAARHKAQLIVVVWQRAATLPRMGEEHDIVSGHITGHVRRIGEEVLRKERHVGMLGHYGLR